MQKQSARRQSAQSVQRRQSAQRRQSVRRQSVQSALKRLNVQRSQSVLNRSAQRSRSVQRKLNALNRSVQRRLHASKQNSIPRGEKKTELPNFSFGQLYFFRSTLRDSDIRYAASQSCREHCARLHFQHSNRNIAR